MLFLLQKFCKNITIPYVLAAFICDMHVVLYEEIVLILPNKLHRPMHYKIVQLM